MVGGSGWAAPIVCVIGFPAGQTGSGGRAWPGACPIGRRVGEDYWKLLLDCWFASMSATAWFSASCGSAPLRMSWAVLVKVVAMNG